MYGSRSYTHAQCGVGNKTISIYKGETWGLIQNFFSQVEVEDDLDLATLSGTLIQLDKWVFSSVIMAASVNQRKGQTTPLCIQVKYYLC